jgi:parvulin-like peptidyl-prolyl isomerase
MVSQNTFLNNLRRSCVIAVAAGVHAGSSIAGAGDSILLTTAQVTVTQRDYDAELSRLAPDMRSGFATSPKRVSDLLYAIIVNKTLAAQAIHNGLDKDRDVQDQLAVETMRILAKRRLAEIEEAAGREFDAKGNLASAAMDRYLIEPDKFRSPEEVAVSHNLFETRLHGDADARRLASDARRRAIGGEDFNVLAMELSDDPSAKSDSGRLGYFTLSAKIDSTFVKTAFALKQVGDISEPIKTALGWQILRLDGRKEGRVRPFNEVKDDILTTMRHQYIQNQKNALVATIRDDPSITVNRPAVEGLIHAVPMTDQPVTKVR